MGFKQYVSSRKGLTVVSWALGVSICIGLIAGVAPINRSGFLAAYLMSTFIRKKTLSVFIDPNSCPMCSDHDIC